MIVRRFALVLIGLGVLARPAQAADRAADGGAPADAALAGDTASQAGTRAIDGGLDAAPPVAAPEAPPTTTPGPLAAPPPDTRPALAVTVLEKGTQRPVAGAMVALDGAVAGETDAEGQLRVQAAAGSHELAIRMGGRVVDRRRVELGAGAAPAAQLFRVIPPDAGARLATTVRADRAEVPKVAVTGDEARDAPGTAGDPMRVIGLLPGVTQVAWPASLYVVRGANPGNTGFFLDGIEVPSLFHLALGLSVIHPYLIEGVEFYPGGSPANYGPYVSGIMAARTVTPPNDRVHASADVTLYDAGGIVTAPWDGGRGTVALAARYSYTGALFSALQTGTILRYGDYQLRVDHPLGGGQATLFAFGSLDNLGWTNAGQAMQYGSLQFHRVDLRWRRALAGGRLLLAATVGADWTDSTLFATPINVRALSAAPRLIYTHGLGAHADLEIGASANAQTFTTQQPTFKPQSSDLGRSRDALTRAAYATLVLRAGSRLTVSPGVRVDVFNEEGTQALFVEPRLDALFKISEALALKLDGGRYAQMPSLPVSVPGFEAFGLADLGAQTSLGGSVGLAARLPGRLTLDVTGYYQKLRLTDIRNIDLSNPDPTAPDYLVSRDGRAYGLEVLLRRADVGRFFGWLAYTLSWSQRYDDTGVLGRSDWDERHILNFVSGYRFGHGYTVGAGFSLNTGRWAPVIGNGSYQQIPAFYQINVRVARRFLFDRFFLDLYADFENVTLNPETLQLMAEVNPATGETSVEQQGVKLILPTIGVHAQF